MDKSQPRPHEVMPLFQREQGETVEEMCTRLSKASQEHGRGYSFNTIHHIAMGYKPMTDDFKRAWSAHYGVSVDELFTPVNLDEQRPEA